MTNEQQQRCDDLWRELFAAGKVRLMSGMLSRHPGNAPDWNDPATLGCLLAMAREAADDWSLHAAPLAPTLTNPCWTVRGFAGASNIYTETEAEALLLAIKEATK